jgi:rare lipoprotein A
MMPAKLRQSLVLLVALLGVPAAALATCPPAASADPAAPPPTGGSVSTPATSATATIEPPIVISSGAITLRTTSAAMLGHVIAFTGKTPVRDAHRTVTIAYYNKTTGVWIAVAGAIVNSRGAFLVHWRTNLLGRVSIRATVGTAAQAQSASSDSSQAAEITIYHPALATYFGVGFYGKQTACGQTLKQQVIGVANRTLPCGTLVEVSYGDHRLTVPVIDRGPYANGASWDLTEAAAQALGIAETVHIGTLVVGSTANTPTLGLTAEALQIEAAAALTGGSAD